jgi:hypothetical protein
MGAFRAARQSVAPLPPMGIATQTPATQATFRMPASLGLAGIKLRRRRRRKKPVLRKRARAHSRRLRRGKAYLVKGSPAARRHMARLRNLRKRLKR